MSLFTTVSTYASLPGSPTVGDYAYVQDEERSYKYTTTGWAKKDNAAEFVAIDPMPVTKLGTGTADSTKFLRGDGAWAAPPGGGEAFPVGAVFIAVVSTSPATLIGYGTWSAIAAGRVLVGRDSGDTDFDTAEETGGAKTVTLTEAQIPSHTHVQDSHNHTQDAHTHTQNSHNHTQDAHVHTQRRMNTATGGSTGWTTAFDSSSSNPVADSGCGTGSTTATNQAATATNQNATATNQAATATNQNTGGGGSHSNVQPYFVVYMWKRTA